VKKQRATIVEALWSSADAGLIRRASKMGLCCVSPMIFADARMMPVVVAGHCRDRMCPTCMRRRAAKVKGRLVGLVGAMNSPRFLTLTERDTDEPLTVRMNRLTAAVKKLRRTKAWKANVCGGVMVWETTRNVAAGTWHPHVHLILDGRFWAHAAILAEWKQALGGDGSARIEACHDRVKAARYLAKYLAKDADLASWPADTIVEFASAMHRRRLVATFGKSHKVNVDLCDVEPEKPELPAASMSYAVVYEAAKAGHEVALAAAPLLARLGIAFRELFSEFRTPCMALEEKPSASDFVDLGEWIMLMQDQGVQLEQPVQHVSTVRKKAPALPWSGDDHMR